MKFISWNVLYIDFIMKAFPEVPALFLYRDPVEIVASVRRSSTAILEAKVKRQAEFLTNLSRHEIDQLDSTSYLATCYARFFDIVTAWQNPRLSLLEYPELASARFAEILERSFSYRPHKASLAKMLLQFATYSKDDGNTKTFAADSQTKQNAISDEDRNRIVNVTAAELSTLRHDSRNLFVRESDGESGNRRPDLQERLSETLITEDR